MGGDWDINYAKKLREEILDREQIDGDPGIRIPGAAKYKQSHKDDPEDLPDLRAGLPVVVRMMGRGWGAKRSVLGYMGGIVLDWHDSGTRTWDARTEMIIQVVASSSPKLDHLIGRLRSVSYNTWGWSIASYRVVSMGKGKWADYHLLGNRPEAVPD